jgi:spoIIIJ-associated protein
MDNNIINHVKELLQKASFEVVDIVLEVDDELGGMKRFVIKTDDPQLLIGRNGDILRSVNYLVRKFVENQHGPEALDASNFLVDVNDYHARKIQNIKTKARIVADRARSFKRDVELDPMSAYERLIVHSFLSNVPDIHTESTGEGRERKVVIKYKEN